MSELLSVSVGWFLCPVVVSASVRLSSRLGYGSWESALKESHSGTLGTVSRLLDVPEGTPVGRLLS